MKALPIRLHSYAVWSVLRRDGAVGGTAQISGRNSTRVSFGSAATRRLQRDGEARR